MPVQRSHHTPRPQPPRANELPLGQPVAPAALGGEVKRRPNGTVGDASSARALARKAAGVRKGRTALSHELNLTWMEQVPTAKPYVKSARAFARAECLRVATTVGGGQCGPGPASLVTSAALQLAASRWMFDSPILTKDGGPGELSQRLLTASRLADASRQNLLTAYELAAREALARHGSGNGAPRLDVNAIDVSGELAALQRLLGEGKDAPQAEVSTAREDEP